jgi:hypothetical protein
MNLPAYLDRVFVLRACSGERMLSLCECSLAFAQKSRQFQPVHRRPSGTRTRNLPGAMVQGEQFLRRRDAVALNSPPLGSRPLDPALLGTSRNSLPAMLRVQSFSRLPTLDHGETAREYALANHLPAASLRSSGSRGWSMEGALAIRGKSTTVAESRGRG